MNDELEDKILDILNDRMVQDPGKCCEEIHQAYIKAGYYTSPLIKFQFERIKNGKLMSGQEWYTRFQTALHESNNSTSIQGGWITVNLVDEAAAKASGVK